MMPGMAAFPAGSAWALVRDITEGYFLLTERPLRLLSPAELDQFNHELDRKMRDLRGEVVPADDVQGNQQKNRRLSRLRGAQVLLQGYRSRARR